MLRLHAVNHFYGKQHTLWNIDLELATGGCTSLVGLPGTGKTTLVNCITGHQPVESGSITWQQSGSTPCDLMPLSPGRRTTMGISYVPQDRRIFSQLSVEENLHIALLASGDNRGAVNPELYALFPSLYALRPLKGSALTEDDRYQLALACAMVTRPQLLILDEPTRGIGHAFMQRLGDLLVRLNREIGLTILLAEQQLAFIQRVADRFCLLHRGRNVAQGEMNQLDERLINAWMTPEPGG
jgi:ABC-type branched-chain amino acid transport systems, ATPase component